VARTNKGTRQLENRVIQLNNNMKKPDKVITTTYLPKSTMKKLKVYAAKNDRSVSDVMEKAVDNYVGKKPTKPTK